MVKVESRTSSKVSLPSLALWESASISLAIPRSDFPSAPFRTGTMSPSSVAVAMPML